MYEDEYGIPLKLNHELKTMKEAEDYFKRLEKYIGDYKLNYYISEIDEKEKRFNYTQNNDVEKIIRLIGIGDKRKKDDFKLGVITLDLSMFKDYEVIVSTHQNTNHIHNHFILNSVSFKTGKKYNNNRTNLAKLRHISDSLCAEYGLSVLDEDLGYKSTYNHKVLDNDYYKTLKEDLDNVISYSVTLKQVIERLKKLDYQVYTRNGIITIYRNGKDKVRIEKAFGDDYSIDNINKRLYLSRQIIFKPLPQRTIFEEYSKTNKTHKGIYGLFLYYCYLLGAFSKKQPKQYLPYSIRKEIAKLDEYSKQVRFMASKNIETKEDLEYFSKTNYEEYRNLMGKRENLWKKYHRTKSEEDKSKILTEINDIQPKIKGLRKYDKYCKDIFERSESIQNNLNNFDKDMQKEKDNVRSL